MNPRLAQLHKPVALVLAHGPCVHALNSSELQEPAARRERATSSVQTRGANRPHSRSWHAMHKRKSELQDAACRNDAQRLLGSMS